MASIFMFIFPSYSSCTWYLIRSIYTVFCGTQAPPLPRIYAKIINITAVSPYLGLVSCFFVEIACQEIASICRRIMQHFLCKCKPSKPMRNLRKYRETHIAAVHTTVATIQLPPWRWWRCQLVCLRGLSNWPWFCGRTTIKFSNINMA